MMCDIYFSGFRALVFLRRFKKACILTALFLAFACDTPAAITYYVAASGSDVNDGLSWESPKASIETAVSAAVAGDTILVSNGTYTLTAPIYIVYQDVLLQSVNGSANTIIDGQFAGDDVPCVSVASNAVLDGFTITNGINYYSGGGVFNEGTVRNCDISGNLGGNGGGIYNYGVVSNCFVTGNTATNSGGGIYNYPGGVVLDTYVSLNTTITGDGGGIYNQDGLVEYCGIWSNTNQTGVGGGICNTGLNAVVNECSIYDNYHSAALSGGGGVYNVDGATVRNSYIYENYSANAGGGVFNDAGGVLVDSEVFFNNAVISGGGVQNTAYGCVVSNTVIYENTASDGSGGGVANVGGLVADCVISDNIATNTSGGQGGGVHNSSLGRIRGATISGNKAWEGGGVVNSQGIVENSFIFNNFASSAGGIKNQGDNADVRNCEITGNTAELDTGGVYNYYGATLQSCVVVGNEVLQTSGVGGVFITGETTLTSVVQNCIIYYNAPYDFDMGSGSIITEFSCAPGLTGVGNINMEPGFLLPPPPGAYGTNYPPTGVDLRLSPCSPCVNTGTNLPWMPIGVDLDANPRVIHDRVDVGAYEYPDVLPPRAVEGVQASDGTFAYLVRIDWLASPGATYYEVWRNNFNDLQSAAFIMSTDTNYFEDATVDPGVTYYYWIKAWNTLQSCELSAPDTGYAVAMGSMAINISPSFGLWTITNHPATYTGATSGMGSLEPEPVPVGQYTVIYEPLEGYVTPAPQTLEVVSGQTTTFTGMYNTNATGYIAISVSPLHAAWTLVQFPSDYTGPQSGQGPLEPQLAPVGVYSARFEPLPGYTRPANSSGNVEVGETLTLIGEYTFIDSDGDAYSDEEEIAADTDPHDPNSYPMGSLTVISPETRTFGKAGCYIKVSWSGAVNLGRADIRLWRATNSWLLASDVVCTGMNMTAGARLPEHLVTATNYNVRVRSLDPNILQFGNSPLFSVVQDRQDDFDGDGRADLPVYFPPWGMWFIDRSGRGLRIQQFGWEGPHPLVGDFDGDGLADIGVYYAPNGRWYLLMSRGGFTWFDFGAGNMTPVAGDYTGDGRDDAAVYEKDTGNWYIWSLSNGVIAWAFNWGGPGLVPVSGDFNGDGRDDVTVYDQATGGWYVSDDRESGFVHQFGGPGLVPVSGDFDGDGKTDLCVYEPSAGNWHILRTSDNIYEIRQFGFSGAVPKSRDFDGDGKDDLGLFWGPGGLWYLWLSTEGYVEKHVSWIGNLPD